MTLNNNQQLKLGIGGGVGEGQIKINQRWLPEGLVWNTLKQAFSTPIPSENFEKPVQFSEF